MALTDMCHKGVCYNAQDPWHWWSYTQIHCWSWCRWSSVSTSTL